MRQRNEAEAARSRLLEIACRVPIEGAPEVADAIERAYELVMRHVDATSTKAENAYAMFGIRLIQVLNSIGYFGEKGKPLDFEDGSSMMLRNSTMNVGFDYGATLATYIFSELQKTENRPALKRSLRWFADNLRDIAARQKSSTWDVVKEKLASHMPSYALALWLLAKEPEPMPEHKNPIA